MSFTCWPGASSAQVHQLFEAVQRYFVIADGRNIQPALPETLQDLIDGPADWSGTWHPIVRSIPVNPWGHEYEYIIEDADAGYFTIICYGREGPDAECRRTNMREAD